MKHIDTAIQNGDWCLFFIQIPVYSHLKVNPTSTPQNIMTLCHALVGVNQSTNDSL